MARLVSGQAIREFISDPEFVCVLCEENFTSDREKCSHCGGNLVVHVEDREVYDTVLPMCGPRCDDPRERGRDEADDTGR